MAHAGRRAGVIQLAEDLVSVQWLEREWAEERVEGISEPHVDSYVHLALSVIEAAIEDYPDDDGFLFGKTPGPVIMRNHWFSQAGITEPSPKEMLWLVMTRA